MFKNAALFLALALGAPAALAQTIPPGTVIGTVSFYKAQGTPTVAEASDFTAVADTAGSLAGLYFKFYAAGDAICYAPWYKVSGTGTAPVVAGCTAVEVDIATGDTATTVAGNTRTTLNAAPYTTYFVITGATTHIIVTNAGKGAATDGNVGTSTFSVSKTQGVSGALAIPAATVLPAVMGYRVCNDAVNTSTWLAVGESLTDPETDGTRIAKGKCLDCPSCTASALKALRVSAQAAANDYSVTQFKQ